MVPTKALQQQWVSEVSDKFNYNGVYLSGGARFYDELPYILREDGSFVIITTYAAFKGDKFQSIFKDVPGKDEITLIADEAHTMGSIGFRKILPDLKEIINRIGLSATPSRYFDSEGESDVYEFFNIKVIDDVPQYTASFTITEAINAEPKPFLCPYTYNIRFVELETDELEQYRKYTRRLLIYMDNQGNLRKCKEVENILKLRKDIVKKARQKKPKLIDIISEIGVDNFKYAFVYVPEGKEIDYSDYDNDWSDSAHDEENLIIDYTKEVNKRFNYQISTSHFTGATKNRHEILRNFENGSTNTLFAMKCLDEGVDIPRTEIAIFCSSTGNPRQYVQRRGRVLRLHDDKEKAIIYDMIVKPDIQQLKGKKGKEFACEKNLVIGEMRRLIEFAKDSMNMDDVVYNSELVKICDFFEIDIKEFLN